MSGVEERKQLNTKSSSLEKKWEDKIILPGFLWWKNQNKEVQFIRTRIRLLKTGKWSSQTSFLLTALLKTKQNGRGDKITSIQLGKYMCFIFTSPLSSSFYPRLPSSSIKTGVSLCTTQCSAVHFLTEHSGSSHFCSLASGTEHFDGNLLGNGGCRLEESSRGGDWSVNVALIIHLAQLSSLVFKEQLVH